MATNSFFFNGGHSSEASLYEDLTIEALQIYGHDFKYIPRNAVNVDKLYGEDIASSFNTSYDIEMYVSNNDGYEGQELFQKFGIEIRDESTLVVSKRRWNEEVGDNVSFSRPREGDLIFIPFSKSLFEITFVEHEKPFYQLNNLPVYELTVALFEYNGQDLDIEDVDTTKIEDDIGMILTLDSTGAFETGESVTQTINGTTVTGEVVRVEGTNLIVTHVSSDGKFKLFKGGLPITSSNSNLTRNVVTASSYDNEDGENDYIQEVSDEIIDFSESNPFGEW